MRLILTTPPGIVQTGTLTTGSAIVTALTDTSQMQVGSHVSGSGVPFGTLILSIQSATQLTLTQNATATGAKSLTVGQEPLSLSDVKNYLKIDVADDDWLISRFIRAARTHCETELRQALITQTWTLYLDSFPSAGGYYNRAIREVWPSLGGLPGGIGFYPGLIPNSTGVIDIPRPPVQSVNSVQYLDFNNVLQTVDPTQYNVSLGTPSRIQPQYSHVWPISRPTIDSVQISFTSGYGPTPDTVPDVVPAAMMLCVAHWYEHREAVSELGYAEVPLTVKDLLGDLDHGFYA